MLEQLAQLAQQYGNDAVVKNNAVPNEHNEAVMSEASNAIHSGLQKIASEGGVAQLAGLFQGSNAQDSSNPVVQQLTEQFSGKLEEKFGLKNSDASGVAGNLIPQIVGSLIGKAKDPNDSSFQISDLVNSISVGNGNSGLMEAVSKYGSQFGLDQNADGKIDAKDAMAAVTKKNGGGLGGLLGKLFGK